MPSGPGAFLVFIERMIDKISFGLARTPGFTIHSAWLILSMVLFTREVVSASPSSVLMWAAAKEAANASAFWLELTIISPFTLSGGLYLTWLRRHLLIFQNWLDPGSSF